MDFFVLKLNSSLIRTLDLNSRFVAIIKEWCLLSLGYSVGRLSATVKEVEWLVCLRCGSNLITIIEQVRPLTWQDRCVMIILCGCLRVLILELLQLFYCSYTFACSLVWIEWCSMVSSYKHNSSLIQNHWSTVHFLCADKFQSSFSCLFNCQRFYQSKQFLVDCSSLRKVFMLEGSSKELPI